MGKSAAFKYTFPIVKAERRDDGMYLLGFATGPEVDKDNERIAPEAIVNFAKQIEDRSAAGNPLPYLDAHADDGVLRELGVLTKGWVNENFHLGVEVRLNEDNPAAMYLYNQVQKGKQYGMSISGAVLDWTNEFVQEVGRMVRTFKNVVLDEISNTTRPAWYPSFGTVLSKSVQSADDGASVEGENASMEEDELHGGEDAAVTEDGAEEAADEQAEEAAADGAAEASESSDDASETEKSADEDESVEDVDKAGRSISAKNGEKLLALHNEMTETLRGLGLLPGAESESVEETAEKSAQSEESESILKSVTDAVAAAIQPVLDKQEELSTQLGEATGRIEALESAPRTQLPGAISDGTKKSAEDEFRSEFDKASPSEKLRMALAAQHGDGASY